MLLHDLRLAVRGLARRPAFAATAVLLLALGAGANAAVFSVVRGVLLRPLPFDHPDALVAVWPDEFVSNEEIGIWRERIASLEAVAGVAPGWLMALVADGGEPIRITGARVSDNLFPMLGRAAALGRTLTAGDGTPGRERVAVLSDRLWRQRFNADAAIVGRSVLVDQVPHEVVGVMPGGFEYSGRTPTCGYRCRSSRERRRFAPPFRWPSGGCGPAPRPNPRRGRWRRWFRRCAGCSGVRRTGAGRCASRPCRTPPPTPCVPR